jgi:hypothetical protein
LFTLSQREGPVRGFSPTEKKKGQAGVPVLLGRVHHTSGLRVGVFLLLRSGSSTERKIPTRKIGVWGTLAATFLVGQALLPVQGFQNFVPCIKKRKEDRQECLSY